jgi:hypothetical protein
LWPQELPPAADGKTMQPALPVPGAHADMLRLANLIRHGAAGIDGISVTLDSHHRLDIAHPTFWRHADGSAVATFTEISAAQVRAGQYVPRRNEAPACRPDRVAGCRRYVRCWRVRNDYRLRRQCRCGRCAPVA